MNEYLKKGEAETPKTTVTVIKKLNKQQLVQLIVHKSILTQKSKNHGLKRSLQNQKKDKKRKKVSKLKRGFRKSFTKIRITKIAA